VAVVAGLAARDVVSNTAGVQAVVVWQSSQVSPLGMWLTGLPSAVVPL